MWSHKYLSSMGFSHCIQNVYRSLACPNGDSFSHCEKVIVGVVMNGDDGGGDVDVNFGFDFDLVVLDVYGMM